MVAGSLLALRGGSLGDEHRQRSKVVWFGFNLALGSYFEKIADSPEEITSNVSLAQTIDHASALLVPIAGGWLWERVAPWATFVAGVVIAFVSLVVAHFIRTGPAVPAGASVPAEGEWR